MKKTRWKALLIERRLKLYILRLMLPVAAAGLFSVPAAQGAIVTTTADFDTVISSGNPNMFYGTAGSTEIAAAVSPKNLTQEALFSFNTAGIVSQLNTLYGTNNWTITSVDVTFYSGAPKTGDRATNSNWATTNPGSFSLNWLSNDSWYAGQVTYNTMSAYLPGAGNSNLMETVGTYFYQADGTTPLTWTLSNNSSLLSDIMSGGEVTLFGTPADSNSTVGYAITQQSVAGMAAKLTITANPVPIPAAAWLFGSGLMGLVGVRRKFFGM